MLANIKIMTFNILAENCIDFVNPAEYYPHINPDELRMSHRLPKIVNKIKTHFADIVMLQEITYDVRAKLAKLLPEYKLMPFAVTNLQDPRDIHYGQMTLLKKCAFSNIKHDIKFLNKSNTAYSITTCKLCPNRKFIIINVHLDAYDGKIRRTESAAILKWLQPYMRDHIIVIGGDFNTDDEILHKKYTKFQPAVQKKDASSTYLCEKPMIDYIYVKGLSVKNGFIDDESYCKNGTCGIEKKPKCMKDTIKYTGSDHMPVIAETTIDILPVLKKVIRPRAHSKSPKKRSAKSPSKKKK